MRRDGGTARELAALRAEVERLRAERDEAVETLRAIREGEVDAIIVSGSQGEQVFSLTGSEQVYRLIVETMREAAITVTTDGRILFCNAQFGAFVQTRPEQILGRPLVEFVVAEERSLVGSLLAQSQEASVKRRLVFQGPAGPPVPAYVSATALCQADSLSLCLVATDLTELEASTDLLRLLRTEQAALRRSEARYRLLHESMRDAFVQVAMDGPIIDCNDVYCEMVGYTRAELQALAYQDLTPARWHAAEARIVQEQILVRGYSDVYEKEYRRKDGTVFPVELRTVLARDEQGQPAGMWAVVRDVTERKRAEEALRNLNATLEQRVRHRTAELAETVEALEGEVAQRQQAEAELQQTNRTLRMVSAANEAVVRLDDERRLMEEVCRIIVEVGGYRMAWVGFAEADADRSVRPVAAVGCETGDLETAGITWADTARGQGPTGTAIRVGAVQIGTDVLPEPRLAPWRAEARKRGFRSAIALPLRQEGKVFGALTIAAAEAAAFPDPQVKVLLDLAENLSFGIHALRLRTALRESRDQLRALAVELSGAEQRERRRLADVLHDGVQQHLVAARLRAHMLGWATGAGVQAGAQELVGLLEEAIAQTRSLASELSPPALQLGSVLPALEWLAGWMQARHQVRVRVQALASPLPALAVESATLLYQAVRELLLNAVKHAQVAAVEVTLTPAAEALSCTVADAGVGFAPLRLRVLGGTEGGFGLLGIRERLELLGGRLAIESAPGQGSRFTLLVPLRPRGDSPPSPAG